MRDPAERFSNRVENYSRYRPRYPESLGSILVRELGLESGWLVADIGAGTGLSSEPFLSAGCRVIGVEPNRPMREAAMAAFAGNGRFRAVEGRAEATGLEDGSIDLYVAGQAFHWFDVRAARREALRVLGSAKRAVLMWNVRRTEGSAFLSDYEALLKDHARDYGKVDHRGLGDEFDAFFGKAAWRLLEIPHSRRIDYPELRGGLLSASYVPAEGESGCEEMLADLQALFHRRQQRGTVEMLYDARLYLGELK